MCSFHVEGLRDNVCFPRLPFFYDIYVCPQARLITRSRDPADHHRHVVWAGNTNDNNNNNFGVLSIGVRVKKRFGDVYFYFYMQSLSPNVLSDSFVVFLWIWAKSWCIKTNHTGFQSPPKIREGGDRTGAAVTTTLLLEKRASNL